MALVGPRTLRPLAAKTEKQSCVSHSTPEAEIASVNLALRPLSMPALSVWGLFPGRNGGLDVMADNGATIVIVKTWRIPHCDAFRVLMWSTYAP